MLVWSKNRVAFIKSIHPGSIEGRPFFIGEGDIVFLLASSGFGNTDSVVEPLHKRFLVSSILEASSLWTNLETWVLDWKDQPSFFYYIGDQKAFVILESTTKLEQ